MAVWCSTTMLGAAFAHAIPDRKALGMDFAFTSAFIAIARSLWKAPNDIWPWLVSLAVVIGAAKGFGLNAGWALVLGGLYGAGVAGTIGMTEGWITILALAAGTFAIRLSGAVLGQATPTRGPAARALNALPGCLIVSLVGSSMLSAGWREWSAGVIVLGVAVVSRNLPLTMVAGIATIYAAKR